jgi:hypothetical protein
MPVDYDALFSKVQESEQYTREQTIAHVRKLIHPLLAQSLDAVLNSQALEALSRRLKGNMVDHLSQIRLDEVQGPAGREKGTRATSARPMDYPRIQSLVVTFLRDRASASLKEIRRHLKEQAGANITPSQWQSMRKRFPFEFEGARYELFITEGQRTKARWGVKRA